MVKGQYSPFLTILYLYCTIWHWGARQKIPESVYNFAMRSKTKLGLIVLIISLLVILLIKSLNTCFIYNCSTFDTQVETNIVDANKYFSIEFTSEGGRSKYQKLSTTIDSSGLILIEITNRDGEQEIKKSQLASESLEKYKTLVKDFTESNLEENYSCYPDKTGHQNCPWLDIPTKTLIVNTKGKVKKVNIEGLPTLPESVQNLLDKINDTTIIVVS